MVKVKNLLVTTFISVLFVGVYSNSYSSIFPAAASKITINPKKNNKYDSQMRQSDNKANVDLKRTLDVTEIERKKLELQDKAILDVNKSEQMRMEYEMKKLELIEAQRLKNDLEKTKLEVELKKYEIDKEKAVKKARAVAKAKKQEKDIAIYKAILEN